MLIRLATQWDQVECARLFDLVTRKVFPQDLNYLDPIENYYRYASGEEQYVAELDGTIRGLLSIYWPEKFVHTLFVDPDFQRRKIGARMLDHVCGLLPGSYELKVDLNNARAQSFYQSQGWQMVEEGRGGELNTAWWRYRKLML